MARDDDGRRARRQPGAVVAADLKTILVALTHPDDEVNCAGTIAAHRAAGHRVVILWLTRGEMTEVYGELNAPEVIRTRMEQGRRAAEILDAEYRFLAFDDTRVRATPDAAREVARAIAQVRPDAVVTWGDAWVRGMRHPDHQATGTIVRDAITFARLGRVTAPDEPYRDPAPVFTLRGQHSTLPETIVDVTDHLDTVLELAAFHRGRVGWPDEEWLLDRLRQAGRPHGFEAAERFDAWETPAGPAKVLI